MAIGVAALAGCAARGPAPVVDRAARPAPARAGGEPAAQQPAARIEASTTGFHTVARGDTLHAIAFANGLDVRDVTVWNQLDNPDRILVGQRLRLSAPPGADVRPLAEALPLEAQPLNDDAPVAPALVNEPQARLLPWSEANWRLVSAPAGAESAPRPGSAAPARAASAPASAVMPVTVAPAPGWTWPADGALAARFGGAGGKGVDIVGPRNSEVRAAAAGKVVYSGTGLRGYGRLLIIKHPGDFLSAYAHNEAVLVKEGEQVDAGQTIARMGDSDADRVKLHFEIRRYGKPLDPLVYLPERS